jgi:hypothetical protein
VEGECHDIMEDLAVTKMEQEATSSLRARDKGTWATVGSFACTVVKEDDEPEIKEHGRLWKFSLHCCKRR